MTFGGRNCYVISFVIYHFSFLTRKYGATWTGYIDEYMAYVILRWTFTKTRMTHQMKEEEMRIGMGSEVNPIKEQIW